MSELSINKPTTSSTQQNLNSDSSMTTITITTENNNSDSISQEDDWQLLVNRIYLTVDSNIPNDLIQNLLVKIKEWFVKYNTI